LLAAARSYHLDTNPDFCANQVWYGFPNNRPGLKFHLANLARQGHPILGTSEAYDVAYETIYQALPDCRGQCPGLSLLDV
jgi:hypothetical protein